jgi:hypothetical protein
VSENSARRKITGHSKYLGSSDLYCPGWFVPVAFAAEPKPLQAAFVAEVGQLWKIATIDPAGSRVH